MKAVYKEVSKVVAGIAVETVVESELSLFKKELDSLIESEISTLIDERGRASLKRILNFVRN